MNDWIPAGRTSKKADVCGNVGTVVSWVPLDVYGGMTIYDGLRPVCCSPDNPEAACSGDPNCKYRTKQ